MVSAAGAFPLKQIYLVSLNIQCIIDFFFFPISVKFMLFTLKILFSQDRI